MDPRLWYQRSQPRQEIQRLKEHMRRSIPVRRLESREGPAAAELKLVLRLADAGKLRVGAASGLPSAATQRLLAEQFASGDFYALEPAGHKPDPWGQTVGPLRAFAWPLLLQSGGLALRHGSRLTLTKSGRSALAREPAGLLSALWRKWLKGGLIDELRRIEAIKGQTARGRGLTQVRSRWQAYGRLCEQARAAGRPLSGTEVRQGVMGGALLRLRPVVMTAAAIMFGLLPIMLSDGTGSELMRRIAAPMLGGMASALVLTLLVLPAVYFLWKRRGAGGRVM